MNELVKRALKVLLEFIARLILNLFKIAIGFSFGYATRWNTSPVPVTIFGASLLWALGLLAVLISAVETWQDWEVIVEKGKPADAVDNHTPA